MIQFFQTLSYLMKQMMLLIYNSFLPFLDVWSLNIFVGEFLEVQILESQN